MKADESNEPLSSVTSTWRSPVVLDVTRNGTPAILFMVSWSRLENWRSPRFGCSAATVCGLPVLPSTAS